MSKFDVAATFGSFSVDALTSVLTDLQALIESKQLAEMAALKEQLDKLAKKKGYTLEQVIGKPRKQIVVRPKYRGAEGQIWTGRGVAPAWMPKDKEQWPALLIPEAEIAAITAVLN